MSLWHGVLLCVWTWCVYGLLERKVQPCCAFVGFSVRASAPQSWLLDSCYMLPSWVGFAGIAAAADWQPDWSLARWSLDSPCPFCYRSRLEAFTSVAAPSQITVRCVIPACHQAQPLKTWCFHGLFILATPQTLKEPIPVLSSHT